MAARKPGAAPAPTPAPTPAPALSKATLALLERLDTVTACLADPKNEETQDALWTAHVRSATTPEGEPLFNEAALKLAYVEVLLSNRTK